MIWHGGGWLGWNTQMTLLPDFGIGIAVFTNRSPNGVTEALTYFIIDRLRGREPVAWRDRFRQKREKAIAQIEVDRTAWEKRPPREHATGA